MPFEFVGRALRDAAGIFTRLTDEVGNGRANREDDVVKVKRAFGALGRMEEPEDEPNGFIDRALDTAIRGFQRDKGLRVDGFMRPGGPTERSLQDDLRGLLGQERGAFGSTRGDRLGSLGRSQDRFGSFGSIGRFGPAVALRSDGREAGPDDGRTLAVGGLDDPRSRRDRAPTGRSGGPLSLLDLRSGRGDVHALQSRPEQDQGGARTPQPRDEEPVRQSRSLPTTAEQKPREPEPARLKPFLDKAERNLRRTAADWRKEGLTDAAHHLEHFLDGSGEPITYNREQARSFSPIRDAEESAHDQIRARVLAEARSLKDGETRSLQVRPEQGDLRVRHGLGLLRGLLGDVARLDDNLATGATGLGTVFEGTISRKGDEIAVDGSVEHKWEDRYDFHSGQLGADAALSVQRYRGAKPFTFGAAWKQRLTGKMERRRDRLLPKLSIDDVD